MAKRRVYPLEAHDVDKATWLYFERKGVCVIRQVRDEDDVLRQMDHFYLPWRSIMAAARVHRRAKIRRVDSRGAWK